ncbi:MAG: hypothetical protein CMH76_11360 [Nitrospinae bacterium]|nr:hypothetical protein [Nitrospinota bacterium]
MFFCEFGCLNHWFHGFVGTFSLVVERNDIFVEHNLKKSSEMNFFNLFLKKSGGPDGRGPLKEGFSHSLP